MLAVWFRLRAEARRRWRAWLALSLLVGLGGGTVLASLAGARRSDSAYDRFLAGANPFDVVVVSVAFPIDFDAVARLPEVADTAGLLYGLFDASLEGDASSDPLIPTDDAMFGRINRPKVIEGRRPHPESLDEVAVTPLWAEKTGLGVGDSLTMRAYTRAQLEELFSGEPPAGADGRSFTLRIVGIEVAPTEFLPSSPNPEGLHFSPAFGRTYGNEIASAGGLGVKLKRGSADADAFKAGVERLSGDSPVLFISADLDASQVKRSIHLQAVALRLFAGLTAVAALLILGQAFARQAALEGLDYRTLRSVGFTQPQLWSVSVLRVLGIALSGALAAVAVAYAASPLMPFGIARTAEPKPGLAFDATALLLGAGAIVLLVVAFSAVPTWRSIRHTRGVRPLGRTSTDRPARLAERAARAGLPPPAVTGVRMATEPGRGATWVPTRSALVSTVVCVAAVAVAGTYTASLRHLFDTPRLYGWNWDVLVGSPYASDVAGQLVPLLRGSNVVSGISALSVAELDVAGERVPAMAVETVEGSVLPPVISGRAPRQADEILVGSHTLRDIGRAVGDTITVRVGERSVEMRIVGRGVLPRVTDALDVGGLGQGALLTHEGMRRLVPDAAQNIFAVRFAAGTDEADGVRALEAVVGDQVVVAEAPKSVADFGRVENMPAVLTSLLALLAIATLAHTLVTVVRRRRRELAILKTLGFVRGQVRASVAWQSTTLIVLALLIGVPLGIAAGRWTWMFFADSLGIVPETVVPVLIILAIVPVAIAAANLVAAIPGGLAARVQPAAALQSE